MPLWSRSVYQKIIIFIIVDASQVENEKTYIYKMLGEDRLQMLNKKPKLFEKLLFFFNNKINKMERTSRNNFSR